MSSTVSLLALLSLTGAAQYGPLDSAPTAPVVVEQPDPATPADDPAAASRPDSAIPTSLPGSPAAASLPDSTARQPVDSASPEPGLPRLQACLDLLRADDHLGASQCYRAQAAASSKGRDIRVAAALARLSEDMAAADSPAAVSETTPMGDYLLDGKAELVAWSGAYGLWLGGVGVATVAVLAARWNIGSIFFNNALGAAGALSAMLLTPVLLGAGGMALAVLAVGGIDGLSAGDANLIRSSLWLAVFDAAALALFGSEFVTQGVPVEALPLSMLLVSTAIPAMAIGASTLVDLHDGGIALANSAAIWTGVLGVLGLAMSSFELDMAPSIALVAGASNVAWLAGVVASPWLPFSRPETWALDLGAGLGLASGAALAIGLRAPNPVLGFGTMAAGTVLGGAAGLALAYFGRRTLEGFELPRLPDIVAAGPALLPGPPGRDPVVGLGLRLAL